MVVEREELRRGVLASLAAIYEAQGTYDKAVACGQRQLELEPWREGTYRQVMCGLVLSGDRAGAPAQYEACRGALEAELEIEPAPETMALYERIRVGEELETAGAGARLHTLRELLHTAFLHRTEAGCFEVHEQLRQYGAWQWQHALECGRVVQIREFLGQSIGGIHQPHYSMG